MAKTRTQLFLGQGLAQLWQLTDELISHIRKRNTKPEEEKEQEEKLLLMRWGNEGSLSKQKVNKLIINK